VTTPAASAVLRKNMSPPHDSELVVGVSRSRNTPITGHRIPI
jgi:hypothetical protein